MKRGVLVDTNHSLTRNATREVPSAWKKQYFKKCYGVKVVVQGRRLRIIFLTH